ncbi:SMP-30/gluconolactonase/LRE family protein [Streptomyces sp. NRRL B-24484]|uniref:SMP-30/gluconolactonase/LRE family protein n=1 Tax=Streptomyces sp. NRRL B-24484 TaxID=1463833 RepID=UPI0004C092E5|nr:SMP-30/gluconolactonase/LRE family protein [Streptomyces sp. NRRL B-24484]
MTAPRVLLDGLVLGESPRWHDDRLWFCDWGAHELITVDAKGTRESIGRVEAFPFCIDPLPDGRLLVLAGSDRRLLRREPDGTLTPYADLRPLCDRPWNEVAADGRGNAYANCIGFDLMSGEPPAPGLIALVTPDGTARTVAGDLGFPNGMALTPDGATLLVAESYASRITAFDIAPDGGLTGRRTWAEVDGSAPDGISLDAEGALWYADVPDRRCVRVREGGEVLQTVETDRGCFSCALGTPDGTPTLYITAAEWTGTAGATAARTGLLLTTPAPAPPAPRP